MSKKRAHKPFFLRTTYGERSRRACSSVAIKLALELLFLRPCSSIVIDRAQKPLFLRTTYGENRQRVCHPQIERVLALRPGLVLM